MKRRMDRPVRPDEGWLIAAVLGVVLAVCLCVHLNRLPGRETLEPVHAVPVQALRRAELVNLNTADADELAGLPGIGEELAGRIADYRKTHGDFASVDELMQVPGIGEGKLEGLRDSVYIE